MNTAQQLIKALAIALAVMIIGGMVTALIVVGATLSYIFDGNEHNDVPIVVVEENVLGEGNEDEGVKTLTELRIQSRVANVLVMPGDELQVKAADDRVDICRDSRKLEVREKDLPFWERWGNRDNQIVVVLPQDVELEVFALEAGAGRVEIRGVEAKQATIDLGAGKTELSQLIVSETTKINGGAGHLTVTDSDLHNLDLDMGVGLVELMAALSGSNQIDAGVGKLELTLAGGVDQYQFKVEKGIGSITLNGEKLGDVVRGGGDVILDIDGGVGAIEIHTN